jgi:hypothetical protein|nr:MAG TPA: hypothetical protein [Caudoviricetes sp.]
MNSNPMVQVMNLMRNGGNPVTLLNQMTGNNPMVSSLMQSMQGKSPEALRQMAMNIAKERGVDLIQFAQQFGMKL